jgi:adenosylmethionine-8-amino-7-oxononanoate aminotransferase
MTTPLAQLDKAHVWHPFTPMRQWQQSDPLIIERAEGFELIDSGGRRYIDGVSSLWCNVHGHRHPKLDQAIRDQLDQVAHTTLLGLASPPSIELAARLIKLTNAHMSPDTDAERGFVSEASGTARKLNKVFYSDAGATALEVAFKMAVGYWHHRGQPKRTQFIGLRGAYHGDTNAAMSVGYSDLFHRPFQPMTFPVTWFDNPDACRPPDAVREKFIKFDNAETFPSESPKIAETLLNHCIDHLKDLLEHQGEQIAAVVIEPVMQGAAGMICQPAGFVRRVRELCNHYRVLMIADEVATGFGRSGSMFAYQSELDDQTGGPDLLCLAKGLTAGYLPVAATLATDEIFEAFCGEPDERRTLYHGHTFTGNPLGCAVALANLDLFETEDTLGQARRNADLIRARLAELNDHPHVLDVRQRGVMVGIELTRDRHTAEPFDFSKRTGAAICEACREQGVIIRPLGDVLVLMPAPAMDTATLSRLLDVVLQAIQQHRFH